MLHHTLQQKQHQREQTPNQLPLHNQIAVTRSAAGGARGRMRHACFLVSTHSQMAGRRYAIPARQSCRPKSGFPRPGDSTCSSKMVHGIQQHRLGVKRYSMDEPPTLKIVIGTALLQAPGANRWQ
jgi:hypothetical protein